MGDDLMDNLHFYNLGKDVPEEAKKPIKGGRLNGKTDINPMWRIKKLTEMFGPCGIGWYYVPVDKWIEKCGDEAAVFVDINLFVRVDGEWSKPIFGTGGNMFAAKEKSGIYVSDECYKMAVTDALSVACKELGIGATVYWDKDKSKYDIDGCNKPETEQNEKLLPVMNELKRIGYTEGSLCKTYKVNCVEELSDLQIKDFMKRAAALPTKEK